ncbi:MAG: hypothetical protein SW833_03500 [Cyanobacteriota bacterium]|nr:hypothetical protein [Cyanobacteriota bacterium]
MMKLSGSSRSDRATAFGASERTLSRFYPPIGACQKHLSSSLTFK